MDVLIAGLEVDLHSRAVSWALQNMGIKSYILDTSLLPTASTISIDFDSKKNIEIRQDTNAYLSVPLKYIKTIWCRRFDHRLFSPQGIHPDDLKNVGHECRAFVMGLWRYIEMVSDARWINPIDKGVAANSKSLQLKIAQIVGLKIPQTLMTNDPVKIRSFLAEHENVIYKPFYQEIWEENNKRFSQLTVKLDHSMVRSDLALKFSPGIYQTYHNKLFELRILVTGTTLLAGKIDSQSHQTSRVDWRGDIFKKTSVTEFIVPDDIKKKIFNFMNIMGLVFGSFDFIVDEMNEYYFLEINEQGQFLFLEERCSRLNTLQAVCSFVSENVKPINISDFPTFNDYKKTPDYRDVMSSLKHAERTKTKL